MTQVSTADRDDAQRPLPRRPWEAPAHTRTPRPCARWLVVAACLGLITLAATTLPQPVRGVARPAGTDAASVDVDRRRPADDCGGACEFSTAGSADLHAFDHGDDGVLHVLFVDARWSAPQLERLGSSAQSWRQTVTVHLPTGAEQHRVTLDHWVSDLPAAQVEIVDQELSAVTFAVTVPTPNGLRGGQLYRTRLLIAAPLDLDGAVWHYGEQIERSVADGRVPDSRILESSAPRHGTVGWCSTCYIEWHAAGGRP